MEHGLAWPTARYAPRMRSFALSWSSVLAIILLATSCGDDDDVTSRDAGPDLSIALDATTPDARTDRPDGSTPEAMTPIPDAAMTDAAPTRDSGPSDCVAEISSTLDGVTIELPDQPCTFTLAEAAAGIDFLYDVVVDAEVANVSYERGCFEPGPSGLVTSETISGGDQQYCVCDVGLCMSTSEMRTLPAGSHRTTFHWEGRNWFGPSDTGNPMGPPFPAGDYVLEITSSGMHDRASFALTTRWPIHLVP